MKRGVYVAVKGPTYETAAEVEMIRRCGGDAVGMSTVKETELAADYGMQVLGISCITNKATGLGSSKLNHTDVTEAGRRVRDSLSQLLTHIIEALPPS
jgi:purine-nucleoside phosphorylase